MNNQGNLVEVEPGLYAQRESTSVFARPQESATACMHSIVAALVAGERFLGPDRAWTPVNNPQRRFVRDFFVECKPDLRSVKEIESVADFNVDIVNRFLIDKGFSIQLDPIGPDEFAAAAVLDLLVEWRKLGAKREIELHGRHYPAVRIAEGSNLDVRFFRAPAHPNPIAVLETKDNETLVWMTVDERSEGLDLISRAASLWKDCAMVRDYGGVIFPMVDLDQRTDISWLAGMNTLGKDRHEWRVSQALQQNKLRMNEKGARAQSAAAVAVLRGMASARKPDLVIDRPFLVWFTRAGVRLPLFVAWVAPDAWKEPAGL